jgi:hypothetical protein
MKVSELIDLLSEENPDANIFLMYDDELFVPKIVDNSRDESREELLIGYGDEAE